MPFRRGDPLGREFLAVWGYLVNVGYPALMTTCRRSATGHSSTVECWDLEARIDCRRICWTSNGLVERRAYAAPTRLDP